LDDMSSSSLISIGMAIVSIIRTDSFTEINEINVRGIISNANQIERLGKIATSTSNISIKSEYVGPKIFGPGLASLVILLMLPRIFLIFTSRKYEFLLFRLSDYNECFQFSTISSINVY